MELSAIQMRIQQRTCWRNVYNEIFMVSYSRLWPEEIIEKIVNYKSPKFASPRRIMFSFSKLLVQCHVEISIILYLYTKLH